MGSLYQFVGKYARDYKKVRLGPGTHVETRHDVTSILKVG